MAVLGTVDSDGRVWASVVTGQPGFIETVDERTLKIAARASSSDPLFRNLTKEGHVALFAPDFVASRRVRVNGRGVIKQGAIYIRTERSTATAVAICKRDCSSASENPQRSMSQPRRARRYRPHSSSRFSRGHVLYCDG